MTHIVCFSGGHSSALVAIEVVRKFQHENVVLLNHDINPKYEEADIKRFKKAIADYLQLPITYANYGGETNPERLPSQFQVCIDAGALTDPSTTGTLCTSLLKTIPFDLYLKENFYPYPTLFDPLEDCTIYYGFDLSEKTRIQRRTGILAAKGYKTAYPLATWQRSIYSTNEIGIVPPATYNVFEHANCKGCLKASLLHWYVVYVHYPLIYDEAMYMEVELNFTIHTIIRNKVKQPVSLEELIYYFELMRIDEVPATEHQSKMQFANLLKKYQIEETEPYKPCECVI